MKETRNWNTNEIKNNLSNNISKKFSHQENTMETY